MKFGQLIEYKNHAQNVIEKLFPDQYSKVLYILFQLFVKLRTIESD